MGSLGRNMVVSQRHLLPAQGWLPQPSPHGRAHLQGRGRGCALIRAAPSEARAFLPTLLPFPPRGKTQPPREKNTYLLTFLLILTLI